jgi:hypothetical protein
MAGVVDDAGGSGGLEVAVFVEDVVGGEETFAADGNDGTTVAEGGGVVERAAAAGGVEFDGADDRGDGAGRRGDLSEGFGDIRDEAAFEEQIARGIAANREFGEDDEFGPLRDKSGVGRENFPTITGEIADGGIELSETKAHGNNKSGERGSLFVE